MLTAYALAWFPMLGLAVLNGMAREKWLAPRMSERAAHQLSTLTAVSLFAVYALVLSRRLPLPDDRTALLAGLLWAAMTVAFEFFMVCVLQRRPASHALADYNLLAGRVWAVVPAALAILPWLAHRCPPTPLP